MKKYVLDGTDGAQTRKLIGPAACRLRLFLTNPGTAENRAAVMRYAIDFLMKHNITFSLAPGFSLSHSNANTHKGTNQYKPGKKVKQPAIYQHWISKSGPVPVPDCWDFATVFTGLFLKDKGSVRRARRACQSWS